jgi:hypothetical protein
MRHKFRPFGLQVTTVSLISTRLLGCVVIAHAVANALLPMHGALSTAPLSAVSSPGALYALSLAGFSAAGLGLLGLRLFRCVICSLLVLSAGLSLVALVRFPDAASVFAIGCNLLLLALGLWRGYRGWPVAGLANRRPAHQTAEL